MPLGRQLSRFFKQKETNDKFIPGNQQPPVIHEEDENPVLPPAIYGEDEHHVIPPAIREEDEQAIIAATTASLQDENARLEAQMQSLQEQKAQFESGYTTLQHENARLEVQLQSLQEQKTQFERENTALQNDYKALNASNQGFQTWVGRAREKFAEQSRKIQNLEQQLAVAMEPMDQTSQHAYSDRLNLLRNREELEASFNAEKIAMTQEIKDLKNSLVSKEQDKTNLQSQLSLVHSDLDEERAKGEDAKVIIQALEVDRDGMIGELVDLRCSQSRLKSLFGGNLTPRLVLVLRMIGTQFPRVRPDEAFGSPRFLQTYKAEDLGSGLFDIPLEGGRLDTLLDSTAPGTPGNASLQGLSFLLCPACKTFKFSVYPPNARNRRLNEFPNRFRQTLCCSSIICSACLIRSLKASLADDWWYELGSQSWLKCPIGGCGMPIGIRRADEIANILRDFGEQDIQLYTSMFALLFQRYIIPYVLTDKLQVRTSARAPTGTSKSRPSTQS
jgi:predicted  nucleic acid-binding Zn-ribbon protein